MSPTHAEVDFLITKIALNNTAFNIDDYHIRVSPPSYAEWRNLVHSMRYEAETGMEMILAPTAVGRISIRPDNEIKPGDWGLFKGNSLYTEHGWLNMGAGRKDWRDLPEFTKAPEPPNTFLEELKKI